MQRLIEDIQTHRSFEINYLSEGLELVLEFEYLPGSVFISDSGEISIVNGIGDITLDSNACEYDEEDDVYVFDKFNVAF